MIELIKFSLKRKLANKTQIILLVLTFVVCGTLFFSDKIINLFDNQSFNPLTVYLSKELFIDKEKFIKNDEYYHLEEYKNQDLKKNEVKINYENNEFTVISNYPLDLVNTSYIELLLSSYSQYDLNIDISQPIINYKSINNLDNLNTDRQNISFLLLTIVYFVALSYINSLSSEIVQEKTGHILDMILTSVSAKTHFLSKIITGWLSIMIQNISLIVTFLFWYAVRVSFDGGKGLIKVFKQLNLITSDVVSFKQFVNVMNKDSQLIVVILCFFIYMIVGVLIAQLILAIVSSFTRNIEEANGIQAISYIVLLFIYYLSLYLNEPYSMSDGLGKWLSFVPFFSMLFMPCRIMLNVVSWYEVLISIVLSIATIVLIIDFGSNLYEIGLLDSKESKSLISKDWLLSIKNKKLEENNERV